MNENNSFRRVSHSVVLVLTTILLGACLSEDEEQTAAIDALVNERLAPAFGYTEKERPSVTAASAGG